MEVVNCSDETLLKIRALYKADDNGCERVVVVVGDVRGGGSGRASQSSALLLNFLENEQRYFARKYVL